VLVVYEKGPRMAKLIGIDPGITTGWAVFDNNGHVDSGVWEFQTKRMDGAGMCYLKFRKKLSQLYYQHKSAAILFEEIRSHKGVSAAHKYGGFTATLMAWCEKMNIPYESVPVGCVKQEAAGKGNASKAQMIAAAALKWPNVCVADDNQADAMWIAEYGRRMLIEAER